MSDLQDVAKLVKEYTLKLNDTISKLESLQEKFYGSPGAAKAKVFKERVNAERDYLHGLVITIDDLIRHASQLLDHGPSKEPSTMIELRVRLSDIEATRNKAITAVSQIRI